MKRRSAVPTMLAQPLADTEAAFSSALHEAKTYIHREPGKAVLWAMAGGYLLRMLPLAAILNAGVRTVLLAVRPAVFLFAFAKAWDAFQQSTGRNDQRSH